MIDSQILKAISYKINKIKENINAIMNTMIFKNSSIIILIFIIIILMAFYIKNNFKKRLKFIQMIFLLIPYNELWDSSEIRSFLKIKKKFN